MAAHVYTALKQILPVSTEPNWEQLDHALGFAPWADQLDYDDFRKLVITVTLEDTEAFEGVVIDLLPVYRRIWLEMGCPRTAEEWSRIKYKK